MPSVAIPPISGGFNVFSGWPFSGQLQPVGSIQLRLDPATSGFVYVGLSGGVTIRSGAAMDGMPLGPGEPMMIPALGCGTGRQSGHPQLWVAPDAAASGCLLFYERY